MIKNIFIKLLLSVIIILIYISCQKELSCENCMYTNHPPVANAGKDTAITLPTNTVTLDGSASSDPDNNIISYAWKKIAGPLSINIVKPNAVTTQVTNLTDGIYQFELKVTDADGLFANDTITISVHTAPPIKHAPVANAGNDTTINLPANSVKLDGSQSTDPDNNITSYQWTKISGPSSCTIKNANAAQTPAINLVEGAYQFELKVTDAGGLYDMDTILVKVESKVIVQQNSNVFFYFPDPTASFDSDSIYEMTFTPSLKLVIVKITNFPDGNIYGIWCNSCHTPICPIDNDYFSDPDDHTGFLLPPGTYHGPQKQ